MLPHYAFLGSFIPGVFLLQWRVQEAYPAAAWLLLGIAAAAGLLARTRSGVRVSLAAAGLALALLAVSRSASVSHPIGTYATGAPATLEGTVIGLPDDRQTKVQYVLLTHRIRLGTGSWIPVQDRVLLTDRTLALRPLPGDAVTATGRLEAPQDTDEFSYRAYLGMRGIHAVMTARGMTPLACTRERRLERTLTRVRAGLEARIGAVFPEPSAALLSGLLTGRDDDLPAATLEDFRRTGMSHLTAVSGSNITVVLSTLSGLLFFLPLRWRFLPCVAGVILFTLLTGAGASVVRAAITGILGLIALHTGRIAQARLTMLWTAFFMLLWNPAQLWLDMGFQLSFLAVIGLIELRPLLSPLVAQVPAAFGLREALQTTLAAQFTAMPWAAYRFGLLSLVSPLANLAAAPLAPLAMTGGFLGVLAGMLGEPLGRLVGLPALLALEGVLGIARFFAHVPFAAVEVALPLPALAAYYALLTLLVMRINRSTGVPAVEENRDGAAQPRYTQLLLRRHALEPERVADHP